MATERVKDKVQMKPRWLTISAITGRGMDKILPLLGTCTPVQLPASLPPSSIAGWRMCGTPHALRNKGKTIKIFYIVQYGVCPPRFKFMVNSRALIAKSFAYYLENQLREDFDMWGIPLVIDFEGKEERYS